MCPDHLLHIGGRARRATCLVTVCYCERLIVEMCEFNQFQMDNIKKKKNNSRNFRNTQLEFAMR